MVGRDGTPAGRTASGQRLRHERLFLVLRDPCVVLLDVQLSVEAEELRVGPEEPLRVRVAGQHLPALLLDRRQIPLADPDRLVDVSCGELAAAACFLEARTDLEHCGGTPLSGA
jgi:hypothetical protein